ncbi:MAG: AMP-binding protein, partial [Firmicutes bacterium]|nr:AMP-binding protein [Bacillota bacterium]
MTLASYHAERDAFRWQIPPHGNIGTAILERHSSNQIAVYDVDDDLTVHSYTFGDLKDLANRLSQLMHHLGVGRGDRVGIFCSQSVELVVAHLATYRI